MRPSFLVRLINGPLFDPVVFIRLINRRTGLLFDCGRMNGISNRELLSVRSLFVSHLHMDHFMGFDQVLRAILHREMPLEVFGPEGVADRVISRLSSYTWNLTTDCPLEVIVREVRDDEIVTCTARARDSFRPASRESSPRLGPTVASDAFYRVDALVLDHNVPCLGFVLAEPAHINIDAGRMAALGLRTGPWITELKRLILSGRREEQVEVPTLGGSRRISVQELLREIVIVSRGQKIAYITDIRASETNLDRIMSLAHDTDVLFVEAYYLEELREQAWNKAHLTAMQAGLIARMINARKVVPMHVSPRYHDRIEEILKELEAGRSPG
jgi:ribonuclease Z